MVKSSMEGECGILAQPLFLVTQRGLHCDRQPKNICSRLGSNARAQSSYLALGIEATEMWRYPRMSGAVRQVVDASRLFVSR